MMEGSTVFYWAEEFWPDEPGDQTESLTGKSQEFSSMFGGVDSYEALPMNRSITLTEEGVAIEYDGLGREDYIKDDSLPRPHDSKEAMAEMMSENIAQTVMDYDDEWDEKIGEILNIPNYQLLGGGIPDNQWCNRKFRQLK